MPNFTCFVYDDGIVLRRVNRFWIVNFYGQYKIRIDSDKFRGLFNDEEAETMAVLIAIIKQKYQETQATTECKDDYLERISNAVPASSPFARMSFEISSGFSRTLL